MRTIWVARVAMLPLAVLLTACGAHKPDSIEPSTRSLPALPASDYRPTFPAQRSAAADSLMLLGDEAAERSQTAFRNPESHTMWLPASNGGGGWALYSFAGLAVDDKPALVEIELTGDLPAHFWVGFGDYALNAWHWERAVPGAGEYFDVRSLGQPVSAGGAFHVAVVADAEIPTEIAQVSLYSNLPPAPPTHVVAEPGAQSGEYVLSWARAETATGYEIYRDSQLGPYTWVDDVATWTDETTYGLKRTYWLKAVNEHGTSGFSQPAYGWPDAWHLQRIDRWGRNGTSLAVVEGQPVVAYVAIVYFDEDAFHFPRFARATTAAPRSPADWVITEWNEWDEHISHTSPPSLAVLGGKPAFTVSKRYYRALTSTPDGRDDWQMHIYDEGANVSGAAALLELNGLPHIVYIDSHVDVLRFARGLSATPASEGYWDNTAIVAFPVLNPDDISFAEINGLPTVSYDRRTDIEDSGNPYFTQALTATPANSFDWQSHIVEDIPGYASGASETELISLADGKPAICYVENYPGYTGLRFARTTVPAPTATSDWVVHTVLDNAEYVGIATSMWLVDERPAICYYDGEGLEYAEATVASPSGPGDWAIETVYEGEVRDDMCLRFINGQPRISFCTKDGLYLLTRRE
jgi:hypothetical protein